MQIDLKPDAVRNGRRQRQRSDPRKKTFWERRKLHNHDVRHFNHLGWPPIANSKYSIWKQIKWKQAEKIYLSMLHPKNHLVQHHELKDFKKTPFNLTLVPTTDCNGAPVQLPGPRGVLPLGPRNCSPRGRVMVSEIARLSRTRTNHRKRDCAH